MALRKTFKYIGRFFIIFGTALGLFVIALLIAMLIIFKGVSPHACAILTLSLRETSALYWIPNMYLSDEEIAQIVEENSVKEGKVKVDTKLIEEEKEIGNQDIEIYEISGSTYNGDVMIIKDPSRVFIGLKGEYDGSMGATVDIIAERYDAIAGINGGGFIDVDGFGNGGEPDGFVICDGEIVYGSYGTYGKIVGIDEDNNLVLGGMTAGEALEQGLKECVCIQTSYAPYLIVNGVEQEVGGTGGGMNPRTAIGQRADGAIIFVTVDGRTTSSIGATFSDMIKIMSDYGAVNAASLDGGSSSQMYYKGEFLNTPYNQPRAVPNAFLVK